MSTTPEMDLPTPTTGRVCPLCRDAFTARGRWHRPCWECCHAHHGEMTTADAYTAGYAAGYRAGTRQSNRGLVESHPVHHTGRHHAGREISQPGEISTYIDNHHTSHTRESPP